MEFETEYWRRSHLIDSATSLSDYSDVEKLLECEAPESIGQPFTGIQPRRFEPPRWSFETGEVRLSRKKTPLLRSREQWWVPRWYRTIVVYSAIRISLDFSNAKNASNCKRNRTNLTRIFLWTFIILDHCVHMYNSRKRTFPFDRLLEMIIWASGLSVVYFLNFCFTCGFTKSSHSYQK